MEQEQYNLILEAINKLSQKMDDQERRLAALEKSAGSQDRPATDANSQISVPPAPPAPPVFSSDPAPVFQNVKQPADSNLEENIGIKWFARIGITAFVLGISFFLKYAFDNNWIGEMGRVAIGIISGLALLVLGEKYIRKYEVYGQIMSGGGIAVLYLSIFAAFNFYNLIGQPPAFFMMMLVTAAGIALSVRYDSLSLIMVSILGGFATPFLVSNGQNNQIGLLSYVLILDLAVLVVSYFRKWRVLNLVGFSGTVLVFSVWAAEYYEREALFVTMVFLTLFLLVYTLSSIIYNLSKKENSSGIEQVLMILSGTLYFGASFAILDREYHEFMGFFALLLGIYYFLWAYLIRMLTPEDNNLYNFSAFLTVAAITLAIPIQFKQNIISMAWVIEAALLMILGMKVRKDGLESLGITVLGLALIRLLFVDSFESSNGIIVTNKTFIVYLFSIFIFYGAAWIIKLIREQEEAPAFASAKQLIAILLIAANFLTVFSVSREINIYYKDEIDSIRDAENKRTNQIGQAAGNSRFQAKSNFETRNQFQKEIEKVKNKNSVTLSIFWLIYGIILLAVGISMNYKGVRIGGLILFTLAILKLFFYDLWNLGTLYRIISSVSLGVVLLSISFFYQKYKEKIKQII